MTIYRIILGMRNVTRKSCGENKAHFMYNNSFFFRKSCRLWDNVEKYGTDREATDDIMRRICAACWITKVIDRHTQRKRNPYCLCKATMDKRTRLLPVYVYCPYRYSLDQTIHHRPPKEPNDRMASPYSVSGSMGPAGTWATYHGYQWRPTRN